MFALLYRKEKRETRLESNILGALPVVQSLFLANVIPTIFRGKTLVVLNP